MTNISAQTRRYLTRIPGIGRVISVWGETAQPVRAWYLFLGGTLALSLCFSVYAMQVLATVHNDTDAIVSAMPTPIAKDTIHQAAESESLRTQAHARLLSNPPRFVDPSK